MLTALIPGLNRLCSQLLNAGMLALLVFTPLAFGAVHVWAFSLMELGIFFLIFVWTGQTLLRHGQEPGFRAPSLRRSASFTLPCTLFFCLVLFQLLPLPPSLLHILSPSTYQLYQSTLPGWPHQEPFADLVEVHGQHRPSPTSLQSVPQAADSRPAPQPSPRRPLSLYPPASQVELLKLVAYVAFFALVARRGSPFLILFSLITLGTGLAFLAFFQRATWNGKLLWFFVPHHWTGPWSENDTVLRGPFVNANHFAGYLEMILPLAVAAVLVFGRRLWRQETETPKRTHAAGFAVGESLRSSPPALWRRSVPSRVERHRVRGQKVRTSVRIARGIATLSSPSALFCELCVLAAIIILTALVFTFSRGGFSATFAALFFMAWLLWPSSSKAANHRDGRGLWAKLGRGACVLGFLAVPVVYLEYSQVFGRFLQLPQNAETGRLTVYAATLALWRDFPLLGVGLGNVQEVFSLYQPSAVGQVFYNYTHNDYLQLLAETGIVGFGLFMWALGSVLYKAVRSWHWATGERRLWLAGILAGIMAMALHSLVDFNLRIPANALLFVTLLALSIRLGQRLQHP